MSDEGFVKRLTIEKADLGIKKLGVEHVRERPCPRCGGPIFWKDYGAKRKDAPGHCYGCKAAYMREWRKAHPDGYTKKIRARAFSKTYKARGKIKGLEACENCGDAVAEMHHLDYDDPFELLWLCRPCHVSLHQVMAKVPVTAEQVSLKIEHWIAARRKRNAA